MLNFLKKLYDKKQKELEKTVNSLNAPLEKLKVGETLEENLQICKRVFADMDVITFKEVACEGEQSLKYLLIYCDGMVDRGIINDNVLKPLMSAPPEDTEDLIGALKKSVIHANDAISTDSFKDIVEFVAAGYTAVFVDGVGEAIALNTKECCGRAVMEPENEKVICGPKEGFTEDILKNLALIIKRVRTNELKTKYLTVGRITRTKICLCYFDIIADKNILNQLIQKLNKLDIDGVLDSNYIVELIRDNRYSAFRTVGYTERPDTAIAKMLEGRIIVLVDGSPMVLSIPYLFVENFQSSEDYYFNFYYSSFARILRMAAFLLTISIPAFYIAVVAYHHEMLPLPLMTRIAMEQQRVPFPSAIEAVIMIFIFDMLRETGVRMPSSIGQTLSIVGALVIGQAAVEASLVSAPMIIVVAATGITSLLVPKLNAPIIVYRFFFLFLSSVLGFFGFTIAMSIMIIHILNLTSSGVDQVQLAGSLKLHKSKDTFARMPWNFMQTRPDRTTANITREASDL